MNISMSQLSISLFTFLPLIILAVKSKPVFQKNSFNDDYLSIETTKTIKAICALGILFHHMFKHMNERYIDETSFFAWYDSKGFWFVSVFFFISGFGLMKQYIKNPNYKKKFLIKRLPGVLVPFLITFAISLLCEGLYGSFYDIKTILTFLFVYGNTDPFVPYAWYIFVIVAFYIVFAIMMLIFKNHHKLMVLGGVVWFACHVLLCIKLGYGGWWYITSFSVVIGMFWAAFEKEILTIVKKFYFIITPLTILIYAAARIFRWYYSTKINPSSQVVEPACTAVTTALFAICIVLLSMKVKVGNKVTSFIGDISLEIYLFQGLIFRYRSDLFKLLKIYDFFNNPLGWFFSVVVLIILVAFGFHALNQLILKGYKKLIKV